MASTAANDEIVGNAAMQNDSLILNVGDHIQLALAEIHPEVSRFSYPLFAIDARDRPDLYASCVLLECDGAYVLVTAAHAICEIKNAGSAVHLGAKAVTVLPSGFVLSSECGNDPLDIAAMVLAPDFVKSQELEFLPLNRTTLGRQFPNFHLRCIHGYPCTKNKQSKRIDKEKRIFTKYGFTYAGASRQTPVDWSRHVKDQSIHIALQYEKYSKNDEGNIVMPPHPKGISGGGLWLTPNSFAPTNTFLEGIAIEYHKSNSLVFATRIDLVVNFIRKAVI